MNTCDTVKICCRSTSDVKYKVRSLSIHDYFKIWMYSSGAEAKMHANPGLFQKLLAEEHDPKLVETIELGRMFAFEIIINA